MMRYEVWRKQSKAAKGRPWNPKTTDEQAAQLVRRVYFVLFTSMAILAIVRCST